MAASDPPNRDSDWPTRPEAILIGCGIALAAFNALCGIVLWPHDYNIFGRFAWGCVLFDTIGIALRFWECGSGGPAFWPWSSRQSSDSTLTLSSFG